MPEVLNRHKLTSFPPGAEYIGRYRGGPGLWGNPFVVGKDGTREEVIAKHRQWFLAQPELVAKCKDELRGKDLVCFCAPLACHGDTLLEVANG